MTRGVLIFAHNSRTLDYALMSLISGGLAKKHLGVPVSVVTDSSTIEWMKQSKIFDTATELFDQIIIVEKPQTKNSRRLFDGAVDELVPFNNANRCNGWDLTPYDRTLLIDSDFLIFSSRLSEYWDCDSDLMIAESANDIFETSRLCYHDRFVADVGVKLYWATTVMFTKNAYTKLFFDLVSHIKYNYQYFGDIYRFSTQQYRNDVAFSVAKHILEGFEESNCATLPPVLSLLDRDLLHAVNKDRLIVAASARLDSDYCASAFSGIDIHIMNKQSIVRHSKKLLELI